jgi:hypothetical protein
LSGYACGASDGYDGKGGISYASPVYKHLDIIKEAEEFVATALAQEAKAKVNTVIPTKKITISCIKGKITKKVISANPKCPPGYKKRS